MPIIRTPDERFENLPDFPYEPHYIEVNGLRLHYVDEGAGQPILCLHGEPSWSYLYRKVIAPLAVDYRVVAPDFIGFGRSDKFTEIDEYSYLLQHDTLAAFIEALDLTGITLVCQDWGGLIGLPLATEMPERFARLVIMNTGLPTGDIPMGEAFMQWRALVAKTGRNMDITRLLQMSFQNDASKSPEILAAYEAPFPDSSYKAAVAAYPLLVPVNVDDPGANAMRQAREALRQWDKPALIMFSDGDPITAGGDRFFRKLIPTANDQPEIVIEGAGHFLQEDQGDVIAGHIADFMAHS